MAEYQDRTGYDPPTGTGSEPADTIESHWIRKLERDLWARFWGPGVACANYDSGSEYDRGTGWNQSAGDFSGLAPSMGDIAGNTVDHHTIHGSCTVGGGTHTYQDACEGAGGTWTGVTSGDPADVDPANPIDRAPVAPGREPNTASDMTNYPTTSTVALQQHLAILRRINSSIKRTAYSTGGNHGSNRVLLLELSKYGALRGVSDQLVSAADDRSRVRDDHVNKMSDEIEYIGEPLNSSSVGTYRFNIMHVEGKHGSKDEGVYNETANNVEGSWTHNWGSDYWSLSESSPWPWSASGGNDYGYNRPFAEARYRFANWNDMRYFFNQGGNVRIDPIYTSNGSAGGNNWASLCEGEVYLGQHTSYTEDKNANVTYNQGGYDVGMTATANAVRVHNIATHTNHYTSGTGAATSDGITITGLSTGVMAIKDILHIRGGGTPISWFGEIYTVDSGSQVTLRQTLRQLDGTVYVNGTHGTLTNHAWSCSKWYRASYFDGGTGLYTGGTGQNAGHGGDGYIYFDWRLDFLDNQKHDLFVRCMYDNTPLSGTASYGQLKITVHGTGQIQFGTRVPESFDLFDANHPIESITKDNASTSESYNSRYRA